MIESKYGQIKEITKKLNRLQTGSLCADMNIIYLLIKNYHKKVKADVSILGFRACYSIILF